MKKILSILLVLAMICALFAGCDWQEVGSMLGGMGHDLILGLKNGFENGATYPTLPSLNLDDFNPLAPSTTKPTQPTVQAPEIPEGSNFQVHYIDVGQADSILIICDGQAMLIDGGNNEDGATVLRYLQQAGVTELTLMVGTHGHEDHIGGLDTVLNYYMCKELWYPQYRHGTVTEKTFLQAASNQSLTPKQPTPGTTFLLGSAICQVVGPISIDSEEPNNNSIVIKVVYGNTSFLFTGDAELAEETEILDAGYDISCDVLKVGHHGSSSSTKYRWLRESAPQYAIISVGAGNSYGHPHESCLSILEDAEVTVYRTDLLGHIVCVSDGETISFLHLQE